METESTQISEAYTIMNVNEMSGVIERNRFIAKIPFVPSVKFTSTKKKYDKPATSYVVVEKRPSQSVSISTITGRGINAISRHKMKNEREFIVYDTSEFSKSVHLEVRENEN